MTLSIERVVITHIEQDDLFVLYQEFKCDSVRQINRN